MALVFLGSQGSGQPRVNKVIPGVGQRETPPTPSHFFFSLNSHKKHTETPILHHKILREHRTQYHPVHMSLMCIWYKSGTTWYTMVNGFHSRIYHLCSQPCYSKSFIIQSVFSFIIQTRLYPQYKSRIFILVLQETFLISRN